MGMYLLNWVSENIFSYSYSYCTEMSETPVEMVRMDFLHKRERENYSDITPFKRQKDGAL